MAESIDECPLCGAWVPEASRRDEFFEGDSFRCMGGCDLVVKIVTLARLVRAKEVPRGS